MVEIMAILESLVPVLITALAGVLVCFLKPWFKRIVSTIPDSTVQRYFEEVTDAILDAINYVAQTYVDSLKADGVFDADSQKQALRKAVQAAKELMAKETREFMEMAYDDLDTVLEKMIEAAIKQQKLESNMFIISPEDTNTL